MRRTRGGSCRTAPTARVRGAAWGGEGSGHRGGAGAPAASLQVLALCGLGQTLSPRVASPIHRPCDRHRPAPRADVNAWHWQERDCTAWARRRLGELFDGAVLVASPRITATGWVAAFESASRRACRAAAADNTTCSASQALSTLERPPRLPCSPSLTPSPNTPHQPHPQPRLPRRRGVPEQPQGAPRRLVRAQTGGRLARDDGGRARGQRHDRAAGEGGAGAGECGCSGGGGCV
jgi:hypothetical protein